MNDASGITPVGLLDCPGGGQVVVRDGIAYVAHMEPPHGTSIVDVSDPAHPRVLAEVAVPEGTHSHEVQVHDGLHILERR